jgi:hypothetical protein
MNHPQVITILMGKNHPQLDPHGSSPPPGSTWPVGGTSCCTGARRTGSSSTWAARDIWDAPPSKPGRGGWGTICPSSALEFLLLADVFFFLGGVWF